MARGFLVFCEQAEDGGFSPVNAELLGAARRLAGEMGAPVHAAFIGAGVGALAPEAVAFGAERVLLAEDDALKDYLGGAYLPVAE